MLFKAFKSAEIAQDRKLTRFDRAHSRDTAWSEPAAPAPFGNPDPNKNLTRIAHRHNREALHDAIAPRQPDPLPNAAPMPSLSMQLHSDAPISIDILRRALPGRFSDSRS
ncbi:MAG: hypothetical protein HLUCCA08_02000 [Rhodobacteraceae bacterium HLUCCA08]|nr:MAG: hypothetical protein HLUCCA08_02000 [Rhodobacteraceae bacterium HLUCCA08]